MTTNSTSSTKTKANRRPAFDLPRSFDPFEFLSGRLAFQADGARWLISTILRKTANRDTDIWGCVRLHSIILYRVLGDHAGKIVRALKSGGAIETMPYRAGERCKGYRLARRYLGDRCVRMPCVDPWLRERLARERRQMEAKAEEARRRWLPIHHALDLEQRRLTIDPGADDILAMLPEHTRLCQDVLVSRIRRHEHPFTLSSTGRVFNSITGLKRELRHALRIGSEPLAGVGITCAQPGLLAFAMAGGTPPAGQKALQHISIRSALPLRPFPPALASAPPPRPCLRPVRPVRSRLSFALGSFTSTFVTLPVWIGILSSVGSWLTFSPRRVSTRVPLSALCEKSFQRSAASSGRSTETTMRN